MKKKKKKRSGKEHKCRQPCTHSATFYVFSFNRCYVCVCRARARAGASVSVKLLQNKWFSRYSFFFHILCGRARMLCERAYADFSRAPHTHAHRRRRILFTIFYISYYILFLLVPSFCSSLTVGVPAIFPVDEQFMCIQLTTVVQRTGAHKESCTERSQRLKKKCE